MTSHQNIIVLNIKEQLKPTINFTGISHFLDNNHTISIFQGKKSYISLD